ncbi:MAG: hypothetical protein WBV22_09355 [Anaerolineaceae bacterium]
MKAKLADLLSVESMPQIPGLKIPDSFYLVTRLPASLAGMSLPGLTTPWEALFRLGLHRVVCLTKENPNYTANPLIASGHFPLQDLYEGLGPDNPKIEQGLIHQACEMIISFLNDGVGVVIHCVGGTGRTGTVIGCTLRGLGYNSVEILSYLDRLNHMRGARLGWPESKWQAELIKKYPDIQC